MWSRITNIALGVAVFAGFTLTNYLASAAALTVLSANVQQFFASTQYLWYVVIIVFYIVQQLVRDLPRPAGMDVVQELKPIIEQYLYSALWDYYVFLADENMPVVPVRINVMYKVRSHPLAQPKLKVLYEFCTRLNSGARFQSVEDIEVTSACYSADEHGLLWGKGEGTCGSAYKYGQVTFFDSVKPTLKGPTSSLTPAQKRATEYVNSVISLPLWLDRHKKVIGVLNMDSTHSIDETCFDSRPVISLLDNYTNSLALVSVALVDGVRYPYSENRRK